MNGVVWEISIKFFIMIFCFALIKLQSIKIGIIFIVQLIIIVLNILISKKKNILIMKSLLLFRILNQK